MWTLLAFLGATLVLFPLGSGVAGRLAGHRVVAVGLGLGTLAEATIAGVRVSFGVPLGGWVKFDVEEPPLWIAFSVHGALAVGGAAAAALTGPDVAAAFARWLAYLLWLHEPVPFTWAGLWALDAERPVACVGTALAALGLCNVLLAVATRIGLRLPSLGCGFLLGWAILGVRFAWVVWG